MGTMRCLAGVLTCTLVSTLLHAAEKTVYSVEDFTATRSANPVAVSPDGKDVLYSVRSWGEKGPAKFEWHQIAASGGDEKKLDLSDKFRPKGYTHDGDLFGSWKSDDGPQLAIVPLKGAKPVVTFSLPRGFAEAFMSPDGSKFALLADPRAKEAGDDTHTVIDNEESAIYVLNRDGRDGNWWCSDLRHVTDIAWSKDSARLAVVTLSPRYGHREVHATFNLCSASGARKLTELAYPTAGLAWSPDEKELVFTSTKTSTLTPEHVWTVGVEGGAPQDRTPDLKGTATGVRGDGHGSVFVQVDHGVVSEIDRFADGKLTTAFTWPDGIVQGAPVSSPFTDSPATIALSVADPKHSTNVAVANAGQLKKLTTEGDDRLAKLTLGETRVVQWKSKEGVALEGIVTFPPGYTAGKPYPFLVLPHGGPEASDQHVLDSFSQLIAAKGYVVLQPEYRGSTGYGSDFLAAIYQHFGDRAYRDVDSATDFAIAQGWADPKRLAIFGWSAGGFMTSWTVTQTQRYKAAIEGAGITDWLSFLPTSDLNQTDYDQTLQEKDPKPLLKFSAVMYVDKVTTPLLILHGAADMRVPTFQGQEYFTLLKERGKTVRMVTYPGSPHFPTLAEQRRDVFKEVSEWLDKYNP